MGKAFCEFAVIDGSNRMTICLDEKEVDEAKRYFVIYKNKRDDECKINLRYCVKNGSTNDGYGKLDDYFTLELIEDGDGKYKYVLKGHNRIIYSSPFFTGGTIDNSPLLNTWKLFVKLSEFYTYEEAELFCKLAERDITIVHFDRRLSREGFLSRMTEEEKDLYKYVIDMM